MVVIGLGLGTGPSGAGPEGKSALASGSAADPQHLVRVLRANPPHHHSRGPLAPSTADKRRQESKLLGRNSIEPFLGGRGGTSQALVKLQSGANCEACKKNHQRWFQRFVMPVCPRSLLQTINYRLHSRRRMREVPKFERYCAQKECPMPKWVPCCPSFPICYHSTFSALFYSIIPTPLPTSQVGELDCTVCRHGCEDRNHRSDSSSSS